METMSIGALADAAGVSVDTIRFYERKGVLAAPRRRPSGYRQYDAADVERLHRVKRLQALGLTLTEVVDAAASLDAGTATCESDRWRLETVARRLDDQLAELRRLRADVAAALAACDAGTCALDLSADPRS